MYILSVYFPVHLSELKKKKSEFKIATIFKGGGLRMRWCVDLHDKVTLVHVTSIIIIMSITLFVFLSRGETSQSKITIIFESRWLRVGM